MSATAAAQEPTTPPQYENYDSEAIIVQARRRDEAIQDVPAAINAVTAESINDLNLRDFTEVKALAPGLELSTAYNGIGGNARLRGVNFDNNASGNNGTIEFYFNDAPISAGIVFQPMYDIGQIEVQRGPQGTLRGRAAPSGSITINSRKPDMYDFGGEVDLTANTIGTMNFKGALNIPVIEGIAALRVAGLWEESDGNRVRALTSGKDPYARTKSYRVSAVVKPTDWLNFEATYQMLDRDADVYQQAISFSEANPDADLSPIRLTAKDRRSSSNYSAFIGQRYEIVNWRSEVAFAGQRLIYQGQWTDQKIDSSEYKDEAFIFPDREIKQFTYSNPRATSHEVRLQNEDRLFGFLDYVVGFFDNKLNSPTDLTRPTILSTGEVPFDQNNPGAPEGPYDLYFLGINPTALSRAATAHEQSFFGNLTARIGDKFEVSGGLRHINYNDQNSLVGPGISEDRSEKVKKWIYNASMKYNIDENNMVYIATGSSMRPGLNVIGAFTTEASPLVNSFLDLPPETSKSYEIGLKSSFWDNRAQFNVTAYHQKFKNFPYRVPYAGVYYLEYRDAAEPNAVPFNFVGAVPVEVNGIEADLFLNVNRNWNVGITASYSVGKIKNGLIPCNPPEFATGAPTAPDLEEIVGDDQIAACRVNQRSASLPPLTMTFQSEYNFPLSDHSESYIRGLVNFSGKSQTDPQNTYDDVDAYALVNLYAGVRSADKKWDISIFAKNVFDNTTVTSRSLPLSSSYYNPLTQGFTPITSTYTGATVTPPREFGMNVRYSF
jgi:iron complex outermembrane receptor protein